MTTQTITLAGRRFVILAEEDYRKLKASSRTVSGKGRTSARTAKAVQRPGPRYLTKAQREKYIREFLRLAPQDQRAEKLSRAELEAMGDEDLEDLSTAIQRKNDPNAKWIPWEQVKREAGLT